MIVFAILALLVDPKLKTQWTSSKISMREGMDAVGNLTSYFIMVVYFEELSLFIEVKYIWKSFSLIALAAMVYLNICQWCFLCCNVRIYHNYTGPFWWGESFLVIIHLFHSKVVVIFSTKYEKTVTENWRDFWRKGTHK